MSMVDETKQEEAAPADNDIARADAVADPAPSSEPDLDALLSEYDESISRGQHNSADIDDLLGTIEDAQQHAEAQQREAAWSAEREKTAAELAQSALQMAGMEQHAAELQGTVQQLQQTIQAEQWRQHVARSKEDFSRLASEEASKLGDPNLGARDIENYLLAEATRDPELAQAWEAQYYNPPGPLERAQLERAVIGHGQQLAKAAIQITDPLMRARAEKHILAEVQQLMGQVFPDPQAYRANAKAYLRRAIDKMRSEIRRPRIDEDVTADRFAVAQAIKSAGGKFTPEPTPNLGGLSNREFENYTRENYGF